MNHITDFQFRHAWQVHGINFDFCPTVLEYSDGSTHSEHGASAMIWVVLPPNHTPPRARPFFVTELLADAINQYYHSKE